MKISLAVAASAILSVTYAVNLESASQIQLHATLESENQLATQATR